MRDYTLKEASAHCGCSIPNIRAAILRGKLIAWKRANLWLIDGRELDRWNANRKMGRPVKGKR